MAMDVSADGSVIVGIGNSYTGIEAFHWTAEAGMVGLGDLPGGGVSSHGHGISADGSVVVGFSGSSSGSEAFRWSAGSGMIGLGDLPGGTFNSSANVVSADGSVIVGRGSSTESWLSGIGYFEAFRWTTEGGMVGLGDLPGGIFYSNAHGVSADGSVVVGTGYTDSSREVFIWDEINGMRILRDVLVNECGLDLTGWQLTNVESGSSISADGLTIAGYGNNPDGEQEAWIARLPEPSSLSLLTIGGLVLMRWRGKTNRRG
jgi:probable HAF family extracellular repeat protein